MELQTEELTFDQRNDLILLSSFLEHGIKNFIDYCERNSSELNFSYVLTDTDVLLDIYTVTFRNLVIEIQDSRDSILKLGGWVKFLDEDGDETGLYYDINLINSI